jgi:glycosyltransferase involved in cell wall biosynthesis
MSLVSIVIPAYNSAATLAETLDACRAQSYEPIEIIVVDDGSTDETVMIAERYGVRLVRQSNQGPAIARNAGITAAQGDFIQFCDSDDLLHPEKIARSMDVLSQNPDAALVYSRVQQVGADGKTPLDLPIYPPLDYLETRELFCKILKHVGSPIQTSSILVRKAALQQVGCYRADPQQRCAEDWDLLLRLASEYEIIGIPEILVAYRHRDNALTRDKLKMAEGRLQTALYARDYPARQKCFDDSRYNAYLAGRYHVLAYHYWQAGHNKDASEGFRQAAALSAKGRAARYLLTLLSRSFSPRFVKPLLSFFESLRHWRILGKESNK